MLSPETNEAALRETYANWISDIHYKLRLSDSEQQRRELAATGRRYFFLALRFSKNAPDFQTQLSLDQNPIPVWVAIPFGCERLNQEVDLGLDLSQTEVGVVQNEQAAKLFVRSQAKQEIIREYTVLDNPVSAEVKTSEPTIKTQIDLIREVFRLASVYSDAVRLERKVPLEQRDYFPNGKAAFWKRALEVSFSQKVS